jgi:hypothetical protein
MRRLLALLAFAVTLPAHAQTQEINRALIQRDQQSAEFAAQLHGSQDALRQLQNLHARQLSEALVPLSPDPVMAQHFLPYQRQRMAQQRFESPVFQPAPKSALENPLPLPGGPKPGVDPVTPDGVRR